jgi:DNA end-binding protein Ku
VAALIPIGDVIVMNTLRYKNELRETDELEVPSSNLKAVGVNPREVEMARKLVEGMSASWKPAEYRDTYHEDLLALIEKRVQAGQTEVVTEPSPDEEKRPAKGEVIDLMALLKKSVEAKGGKVRKPTPAKARGRKAGRKAA